MITVRFPNGHCLIYNTARTFEYQGYPPHSVRLMDRHGGEMIAEFPLASGAIIEFEKPCRVENPARDITVAAATRIVLTNIREVPNFFLRELKVELGKFNGHTFEWKK